MSKQALIVWGGWDGHQPKQVAGIFERVLKEEGFDVEVSDTLDAFKDQAKLLDLSLIVPIWTMGEISSRWPAFCNDVNILLQELRVRIGRENEELYPMTERTSQEAASPALPRTVARW